MVEELKPCPFCGHATQFQVSDIDGWIANLYCSGCDMQGPSSEFKYDDVEEAKADCLARWNTRPLGNGKPEVSEGVRAYVQWADNVRQEARALLSDVDDALKLRKKTLLSASRKVLDAQCVPASGQLGAFAWQPSGGTIDPPKRWMLPRLTAPAAESKKPELLL